MKFEKFASFRRNNNFHKKNIIELYESTECGGIFRLCHFVIFVLYVEYFTDCS